MSDARDIAGYGMDVCILLSGTAIFKVSRVFGIGPLPLSTLNAYHWLPKTLYVHSILYLKLVHEILGYKRQEPPKTWILSGRSVNRILET